MQNILHSLWKDSVSKGIAGWSGFFFFQIFMVAHSAVMGGACPIPVLRGLKIGGREGGDESCIPHLIFSIYKNSINVFKTPQAGRE